jgi:hypothetical protein
VKITGIKLQHFNSDFGEFREVKPECVAVGAVAELLDIACEIAHALTNQGSNECMEVSVDVTAGKQEQPFDPGNDVALFGPLTTQGDPYEPNNITDPTYFVHSLYGGCGKIEQQPAECSLPGGGNSDSGDFGGTRLDYIPVGKTVSRTYCFGLRNLHSEYQIIVPQAVWVLDYSFPLPKQ